MNELESEKAALTLPPCVVCGAKRRSPSSDLCNACYAYCVRTHDWPLVSDDEAVKVRDAIFSLARHCFSARRRELEKQRRELLGEK